MMTETALVMAGGRLRGDGTRAAGSDVKALLEICGETLLSRTLRAVRGCRRVIVVGPQSVRAAADDSGAEWVAETGTLLGNVQAGATSAKDAGAGRVLLVGADLAFPRAESLRDFLDRSPAEAGVTVPLVTREAFEQAFPGSPSAFVPLAEGRFTIGSQFVAPVGLLLEPPPAVAAMLGHRKSQWQMARTFGLGILAALLTRSLTIPRLEARASEMLGVPAVAVRGCAPDLAMDIDDTRDLAYARGRAAQP